MAYTLQQLAELLGCELKLVGDGASVDRIAEGVATLKSAQPNQLAFLANQRYKNDLASTSALAVIVHPAFAELSPVSCLLHSDPYGCYARATQLFEQRDGIGEGIHASAVIDPTASIGNGAKVAPGVVVGADVSIGDNAEIGPNVVIGHGGQIGDNVYLAANVSINHGVTLGSNVRVQSGTVIGSEGFGYAPSVGESVGINGDPQTRVISWTRIAQLGSVRIGDNVEIGANTSIDRGALDDTVIESDVIIDNQVQVAHNVFIGSGTAIAGCVGIAGSATIGRGCSIGGGAGIAGHLSIADGTTVMGMTLINRSVKQAGAYASGTGMQPADSWRKSAVRFTQLESLNRRVKELEKKLAEKG